MEASVYRNLAALIRHEMYAVVRFERPLDQVLENLADKLLCEASQIEQSKGNDK